MTSETTPARITNCTEDPVAGGTMSICYDFSGDDVSPPVTLTLTWDPAPGGVSDITLTSSECVTVNIPSNARQVTLEDPNGGQSLLVYFTAP